MREIALYGSQVVKVTGSYDQAKQVANEFALQRNLYQDMGARTVTSVEGMKTIAFEIAEQLTAILGPIRVHEFVKTFCNTDRTNPTADGLDIPIGCSQNLALVRFIHTYGS